MIDTIYIEPVSSNKVRLIVKDYSGEVAVSVDIRAVDTSLHIEVDAKKYELVTNYRASAGVVRRRRK